MTIRAMMVAGLLVGIRLGHVPEVDAQSAVRAPAAPETAATATALRSSAPRRWRDAIRPGATRSDPRLWTPAVAPVGGRPTSGGPHGGSGVSAVARSSGLPPAQELPRSGSEFWIPLGSILVPGLGQYMHGSLWSGVGYSAIALAGIGVSTKGNPDLTLLPREGNDQLAVEGAHVAFTSGALSGWDAFYTAMPALHSVGKYDFMGPRESVGDLLTAPVDVRFLGRWTTLVDLAFAAGVAGWVLSDRSDDRVYEPYRVHDAAFVTSLSLNAAVGEEALFRGWLLPMLTQKLGGRFWAANGAQAALFGAGHLAQADDFALVIAASALYSGWMTRRNDWSVREAIFNHFWYDVLVATAEMLTDEARPVALLPISIRF